MDPQDTFSPEDTNLSIFLAFLLTPKPQFQVPIPYASPNTFPTWDGGDTAAATLVTSSLVSSPNPFPKRPSDSMPALHEFPAWTSQKVPGPVELPAP